VAHTLARRAGRQETQIVLTADYADETDFENVLIQICVIGVDILAFFGAADWKIAQIGWWQNGKQIKPAAFSWRADR
jgi:hypothetical protein